MPGTVIALTLAAAMFAMIWLLVLGAQKQRAARQMTSARGQLSAAERRRLYQRLGIDPAALARQQRSNVIWLDPRIIDRRRTDA